MKNPWTKIDFNKQILDCDLELVQNHNAKYKNKISHNLKDFPEPFIGNKDSNIYFLMANPGLNNNDSIENEIIKKSEFKKIILKNLNHELIDIPFYYLNKNLKGILGYNWWNRCLAPILNKGICKENLANNFFVVEICGYHSQTFPKRLFNEKNRLPSINYSKYLIEQAIANEKLIVLARSVRNWFELVPELRNYKNCFFLANNRGMVISETTLSPNGWNQMLNLLE